MTFKQIKTGIINPDTDDGEISIFYMPGPDGMIAVSSGGESRNSRFSPENRVTMKFWRNSLCSKTGDGM